MMMISTTTRQAVLLATTSILVTSTTAWVPRTAKSQTVFMRIGTRTDKVTAIPGFELAFVPDASKSDLLHGIHPHEDDPSPVIHTDTDEVERSLEEAFAEYEELLDREAVDGSEFLQNDIKTPRTNHISVSAMESLSKQGKQQKAKNCGTKLVQLDPEFENDLFLTIYWNAWWKHLRLEQFRHSID